MKVTTINPATEEVIGNYETMPWKEVEGIVRDVHEAFLTWKRLRISERAEHLQRLAAALRTKKEEYARLMTLEMGKTIREARAEVEKCAWTAEVYAENAEKWLAEEKVTADGKSNDVVFEPMGVILSVMPWNFPFWQAFRFAIPTLIAGNASVLRHSNQVPQCAMAIEEAFHEAGFPRNVFRTIISGHDAVAQILALPIVRGVSLTGSTDAGKKIAEIAGRNLKKVVLELGGSDPFIVLEDADIEIAARNAALGRTINSGQSCIAAKRFIVMKKVAAAFVEKFTDYMNKRVVGNPMDEKTELGPLVNENAVKTIERQVNAAVKEGAQAVSGGHRIKRKGYFYAPTILTGVSKNMAVAQEEIFGPVALVMPARDEEEAIKIANSTEFGLGASVWTRDLKRGVKVARQLEAGTVFINSIVKSDPRMPFGGIKESGIGRELSHYGLKEFVNVKGLNVYEMK